MALSIVSYLIGCGTCDGSSVSGQPARYRAGRPLSSTSCFPIISVCHSILHITPIIKDIIHGNTIHNIFKMVLPIILLHALLLLKASHAFQSPTFHRRMMQQRSGHDYTSSPTSLFLSSSDIQAKLKAQMAKLQERDRASAAISPDVSILCAHFRSMYLL